MLGAIIGDIVGSAYEFNPTNNYDFNLFPADADFTDDTICTIAVADALMRDIDFGTALHSWCRRYPNPKGAYGGRFNDWVRSDRPKPYCSLGNGSAMRVSPVGWWDGGLEDKLRISTATAACTHNHPEGIDGARAVAIAIHDCILWRRGWRGSAHTAITPENIFKYGIRNALRLMGIKTDKPFTLNLDDYRNRFDVTCHGTVPVALYIVMTSRSFEDAIRRAVSLGADADTLGAITGSIAEAIWGIPNWMKEKALTYLPQEMLAVVNRFHDRATLYPKHHKTPDLTTKNRDMFTTLPPHRITPSWISSLAPHEVFVFGSNLQGLHMGGAAKVAFQKFGALWGVGNGPTGRSYAIPTMHGGPEAIRPYVAQFINYAVAHPHRRFLLTRIGCGIAGFTDGQMSSLFSGGLGYPSILHVPNITIPAEWVPYLLNM